VRDVAIVGFAQSNGLVGGVPVDEVEMVQDVVSAVLNQTGVDRSEIGFTCSGSSDLVVGRPFSFVAALDGVGAWPPICESHVEMDGAWALYEAWIALQQAEYSLALVYSFGLPSSGSLRDLLALQLDPYCVAPLWPDAVSIAALQARALLDSGKISEQDVAEIVVRSREDGERNPMVCSRSAIGLEDYLAEEALVAPLRRSDCPPNTDGAAAILLACGDRAKECCERPAWIAGIDHRVDDSGLGRRDLCTSPSAALAAREAGGTDRVDVAELHAPFAHQEYVLREAIPSVREAKINPSGGALVHNPFISAGLIRIGEAAGWIHRGEAERTLGHATSGPCLQQNLVCLLEAAG